MSAPVGGGPFLETLGIVVVAAALVVTVARRLRMPTIVAYIVAGLLVGPVTGLVVPAHEPHGALISRDGHRAAAVPRGPRAEPRQASARSARSRWLAGIGQVVFTAAGGFGVCWLLGLRPGWSRCFIATALTFSSTVVVVKLLDQKASCTPSTGASPWGSSWCRTSWWSSCSPSSPGLGPTPRAAEAWRAPRVAKAFGGMGALLVASLLAAKWLLPRPIRLGGALAGDPLHLEPVLVFRARAGRPVRWAVAGDRGLPRRAQRRPAPLWPTTCAGVCTR
jgi:hypothetical protein